VFKLTFKRPLAAVVSLCLLIGLVGIVSAKVKLTDDSVEVKITENLFEDARLARKKGVPIVVMFSQDGCAYCNIVRESFLKPLLVNKEYDSKVLVREFKVDSFEDVRNFDGKMIPADELAHQVRAFLTPTVIVFDSTGKLHHRIVGLVNEHYYSGELDVAINNTLEHIHQVAANN